MQGGLQRGRALILAAALTGLAAVSASAFTRQETPAQWDVAGVAKGGRALDLTYLAGGCLGTARATVRETTKAVTFTVLQTATIPDQGESCSLEALDGVLRVKLAAPLGGRAIKGRPASRGPAGAVDTEGRSLSQLRVPGLVGFSPWEAKRALKRRGLGASIRRMGGSKGLAQVVAQSPAAGATLARGASVRLRVARR